MFSGKNNVGIIGIIFGIISLVSFFIGDNSKLIIPVTDICIVRYFMVITIINGGIYFVLAGILVCLGMFVSILPEDVGYKKQKAKGILFSICLLSPFFISLITTILTLSETVFWKITGIIIPIYLFYLIYSNIRTVLKR